MTTGTVKFFNQAKGFGFIKDDNSDTESFVHISSLNGIEIDEGTKVSYDIKESDKGEGKTDAVNVTLI